MVNFDPRFSSIPSYQIETSVALPIAETENSISTSVSITLGKQVDKLIQLFKSKVANYKDMEEDIKEFLEVRQGIPSRFLNNFRV